MAHPFSRRLRPSSWRRRYAWLAVCALLAGTRPVLAAPFLEERQVHPDVATGALDGFAFPFRVQVSPDGAHVYTSSGLSDAIATFVRDPSTGDLSLSSFVGFGGDPLRDDDVADVVISPDGAHVYAATREDRTIRTYVRDGATGALTLIDTLQVEPLGFHSQSVIDLTSDGATVYVTTFSPEGILAFERDPGTGALSLIDSDTLAVGEGIAISPDDAHVYVFGSTISVDRVSVLERASDGSLTETSFVSVPGAWDGVFNPGGEHLYVQTSSGAIPIYARSSLDGSLALLGTQSAGTGSGGIKLAVSADGLRVLAVRGNGNRRSGVISAFARAPASGLLTPVATRIQATDGNGFALPTDVALSPDGAHAYVTSLGDDAIASFALDPGASEITLLGALYSGIGLARTASIAPSPGGAHLYALDDRGTLTAFARDPGNGLLSFVQVLRNEDGGEGNGQGQDVVVSPDGAHVYVASSASSPLDAIPGDRDGVEIFARSAATGELTFVAAVYDGEGGVDGLAGARSPTLSPAGGLLYVVGKQDRAVAVFSRDGVSGALTFLQKQEDGLAAETFSNPEALAVSPDGDHVYVVGSPISSGVSSRLSVFRREADGTLSPVQLAPAFDARPSCVVVSGDGGQVYVVTDEGVRVHARDPVTGEVTFLERVENGDLGAEGLSEVVSVTLSPDDARLYAIGATLDALVVFARNPSDGRLRYRQALFAPNRGSSSGLEGVAAVSVAGGQVYAASDRVVGVYAEASLCPASPVAGCRAPGSSLVRLKDRSQDVQDSLTFRWRRGEATSYEELGDPLGGTTDYAVCVYDQDGLVLQAHLLDQSACGSRPCWRPFGKASAPTGLGYQRGFGTPDGITRATIRTGAAGKASLAISGKGEGLALPAPPLDLPVTVQILNTDGTCWGDEYTSGQVAANGADLFLAQRR
jgi:6-phosphogluconolactonase (cycloisomerase 2 family)